MFLWQSSSAFIRDKFRLSTLVLANNVNAILFLNKYFTAYVESPVTREMFPFDHAIIRLIMRHAEVTPMTGVGIHNVYLIEKKETYTIGGNSQLENLRDYTW